MYLSSPSTYCSQLSGFFRSISPFGLCMIDMPFDQLLQQRAPSQSSMVAFAASQPVQVHVTGHPFAAVLRAPIPPVCFNRRAEAARRRWQDPEYREKMRAARAANALRPQTRFVQRRTRPEDPSHAAQDVSTGKNSEPIVVNLPSEECLDISPADMTKSVGADAAGMIVIGARDSITLCSEEKAAAINAYVIRNKHRSEKLLMFHNDKQRWIDTKLREGETLRLSMNNIELKRQKQLKRQEEARQRHARIRARRLQTQQVD